jgi:hypothetical protein
MKTFLLLCALCGALISSAGAGIDIRISVKFIYGPGAMPPVTVPGGGNIDLSSSTAFDAEIAHGNRVLDATGRASRRTPRISSRDSGTISMPATTGGFLNRPRWPARGSGHGTATVPSTFT